MAVLLGRTSMCARLKWHSLLLLRSRALSCSSIARSQEELDRRVMDKTLNRLQEDAPFKAYQRKGSKLKHFAGDDWGMVPCKKEEVVGEEKEVIEYTLPHPIWSQVTRNMGTTKL